MTTKAKKYRSEIHASVHETAQGLADAGLLTKQTMRSFDQSCLTPVEDLAPDQIREIRLSQQASQTVFALYLNVTPGLISQWERGIKKPQGASLKLLTLVKHRGLDAVV